MARLLIHVEGQTEETFVNELLRPHLLRRGYEQVSARLLGNARERTFRGGIRAWSTVKKDILRHLKQDRECVVTTMVDYYALPDRGDRCWPGRAEAATASPSGRAACVEAAILQDISADMGSAFDPRRFVPFVVLHEFEGLLFSDCQAFARGVGRGELAGALQAIRDAFDSPEDINDSPLTAPSKRVEALLPGYDKPFLGALAVIEIGLDRIRTECPHFRAWLSRLDAARHRGPAARAASSD